MDRRTQVCIWIIILGLANFIAFTMTYIMLGGDAKNGHVWRESPAKVRYLIQMRGSEAEAAESGRPPKLPAVTTGRSDPLPRFIRIGTTNIYKTVDGTAYKDVGKAWFVYSGTHSITVLISVAAVLLAMLTLAKDHIVTAMEDHVISGRFIIHTFTLVVVLTSIMMVAMFILDFVTQLKKAG